MSEKNTYQPISTTENDYKLTRTTRGTERRLHELIVRSPMHTVEERQFICETEGWLPEQKIPELTKKTRMDVSAIRAMMKRLDGQPEKLQEELQELVERFSDEVDIEPVTADEYWIGLARILLVQLPDDLNADELDFKEIRRAYTDFFEG